MNSSVRLTWMNQIYANRLLVMKILVLCTGNSCRSQMAEGFLRSFDSLEVHSAGTDREALIS